MEEDLSGTEEGGGLQLPKMPKKGCPAERCPAVPFLFWGAGRWKNGDSWSILPPVHPAQRFWGILEMKKERIHSPGAEALWCSPALSAEGEGPGRVLSPHWAPTCAPTTPCMQRLADFRLWIFAEVFFGPSTALRQDSSTLALEKTPVCFNLSFA